MPPIQRRLCAILTQHLSEAVSSGAIINDSYIPVSFSRFGRSSKVLFHPIVTVLVVL